MLISLCSLLLAVASTAALDHQLATWFHAHLNGTTGPLWQAVSFTAGGTIMWVVLVSGVVLLACRKRWHALLTLVLTVPCGVLVGEGIKLLVQRQRPYLVGPFVDWAGYSFPSGHAISATLLYGFLCITLFRFVQSKPWRALEFFATVLITLLVGLSRIALGAHYLTDVIAGMTLGAVWLIVCMFGTSALRRRYPLIRPAPGSPDTATAAATAAVVAS